MRAAHKENNNISFSQKWSTARLRLIFLLPLTIVLVIVVLTLNFLLYEHMNLDMKKGGIRISESMQDFYEESLRYDAKALLAILHTMRKDEQLATALAQRNRAALLRLASPLFNDIKQDFMITHLYFTGVDKVNILRVHAPPHYGDTIQRITMHQAQKNGTVAYGVELGPLGTFTLRVVAPWYDKQNDKLIGYVELGLEVDQVINKLEHFFDVQVFTMIKKEFLEQKKWEEGMRALGRTPNWNLLTDYVSSEQPIPKLPPAFTQQLMHYESISDHQITHFIYQNISYHVADLSLHDAAGREIAKIILLADVSQEERIAREAINTGIIISILGSGILFAFFYWLVGKIGKRIEGNEKELRIIATRDGLTGLNNHKFFYSLLETELIDAARDQNQTALLLLDIDHFKRVNDTYGHRSGDLILRGLSNRLLNRLRKTDLVCRYGGEEITIILPQTELITAKQIAEDLRMVIEEEPFQAEDGQPIKITISIGISVSPQHGREASALVSAADSALYQAKESSRNCICIYKADN